MKGLSDNVKSLCEDPLDLLAEWFKQWSDNDEMPEPMKALHVRTAIVLLVHGRLTKNDRGGFTVAQGEQDGNKAHESPGHGG
jgi:hypothetical protein